MERRNNSNSHNTPAWRRYREAFDAFREKVRAMQAVAAGKNHDQSEIDAAVLAMDIAKQEYNTARDALFLEMIPSVKQDPASKEGRGESKEEIRELAELLWELEGRPEGSALDDWHRA